MKTTPRTTEDQARAKKLSDAALKAWITRRTYAALLAAETPGHDEVATSAKVAWVTRREIAA